MDEEQSPETSPPVERKAYSKPELVEYGKVSTMTQSGYFPGIEDGYHTS